MKAKDTRPPMKNVRLRVCVKEVAEGKGFTLLRLSAASKVDVKTIRRLWNHPETNVLMSTIRRLATALDTSPLDLFTVEGSSGEET
jgi:hypothetical protein